MTQAERLARRAALQEQMAKVAEELDALRMEEAQLLDGCEHAYADGRGAAAGGRVRICSICGRVLPNRGEKLWG